MARLAANRSARAEPIVRRRWIIVLLGMGLGLVASGVTVWTIHENRVSNRVLGIKLALAGNITMAEPLLAAAIARDSHDVDAIRALALGRIAGGQLAEATDPLDRWRELRPYDPEPHLARIDQAMKLNRPAEAIDPARAVLALKPESAKLQEQLTFWLYLTGRTEEADVECRRCRVRNDTPQLKLLHAEIARRLGDNSLAERLTDELLAAGQRTPAALTLRGALALDAGDSAAAIPLLKEAMTKGGEGQSRARHFLSVALVRIGDEAGAKRLLAEEQWQQAVGMWEKYGRMEGTGYMAVIAEGLLATGKTDEAFRLLNQVLVKDPTCRAAHKLLADYYDARGQRVEAAEHRRKAAE